MTGSGGRECAWEVDGLTLRGLQWGRPGDQPVLALHGWQDNAASFQRLAPQLKGCHVVALDLSGQGRSSFRSADATYHIWDDLPQLVGVLDQLGWPRCTLLGHSRGAIISALLAAAQPERCRRLVLLDAVVPQAVSETAFPGQLGDFLRERTVLHESGARRFSSREAAIEARARRGLPPAIAATLAERGLDGDATEGWAWRIDPRLRGASAVKLSDGQIRAALGAIEAPTLLLLATQGLMHGHPVAELAGEHIRQLRVATVEGGHHFHMEAVVDEWVPAILEFLAKD